MKPVKLSRTSQTDQNLPEYLPDLSQRLDDTILSSLPHSLIYKHDLFPVYKEGDKLYIAICRIPSVTLIQELSFASGCMVLPVLIPENEFRKAMMLNYGIGVQHDPTYSNTLRQKSDSFGHPASIYSAVKEIDRILDYAIANKVSDIHFEPLNDQFRVRIRRDGFLSTLYSLPMQKHQQIISRLKVMARLDIAEKRSPQDGNIQYATGENAVDIRVSSLPTDTGEKMVLRILDKSEKLLSLDHLGFEEGQIEQIKQVLESPHGLFIVTGPTGSGKTTTLYSALAHLNREDINILTVEDPVEYKMDGITQVRVRPELGFTFAKALRTFLRQDPDIIMIGEIRDRETAAIAIRAALTGHLVLSTLHTNDSVTTIFRLLDMGIEPFLLCSTLRMIIAQRLVRKICPSCIINEENREKNSSRSRNLKFKESTDRGRFRGKGCFECNFSGYSGRTIIAELLPWTDALMDLTISGASLEDLRNYLMEQNIMNLTAHGKMKAYRGITTIEEIHRETGFTI